MVAIPISNHRSQAQVLMYASLCLFARLLQMQHKYIMWSDRYDLLASHRFGMFFAPSVLQYFFKSGPVEFGHLPEYLFAAALCCWKYSGSRLSSSSTPRIFFNSSSTVSFPTSQIMLIRLTLMLENSSSVPEVGRQLFRIYANSFYRSLASGKFRISVISIYLHSSIWFIFFRRCRCLWYPVVKDVR